MKKPINEEVAKVERARSLRLHACGPAAKRAYGTGHTDGSV
jgi:hypothetical protein